jgi:hypothetical protein
MSDAEFDLENPPWAADEFDYRSENWGDEQDRSEWFEAAAAYWCARATAVEQTAPWIGATRYRARVEDARGSRWSVNGPLSFLEGHTAAQHLKIIWIRPR